MKVTVKDNKTGRERVMPKAHADLLEKLGRVTYLTRDMAAAPIAPIRPVVEPVSAPAEVPEEIEEAASAEVDSTGAEWNPDLHVSTKLKNAGGTWRKKPGAKSA